MTRVLFVPRPLAPLAAAALALSAGAALAQPYGAPPGQGYGAPPGQSYGAPPSYGGQPGQSYGGQAQSEIASLHAALHITAAQESAWQAFVAASQPDGQQQARERSAEQMLPGLTAPQRVDLSIAAMQADLATLRTRGAALKAFYATLTPSQQKTFDRETLPRDEGESGAY